MGFKARLEAFEGPLDLLLHLIKINQVDISDIPVSIITSQYLEYLDLMRALDINVEGDFLVIASTLLHIKSKMLLPQKDDSDEIEDPREEIAQPLKEYLQLKQAANELESRDLLYRDVFKRGVEYEDMEAEDDSPMVNVNLYELMDAFKNVIKSTHPGEALRFKAEKWTVKMKIDEIKKVLKKKGEMNFTDLFPRRHTLSEMIATFLALLELIKEGLVNAFQAEGGGDIRLTAV